MSDADDVRSHLALRLGGDPEVALARAEELAPWIGIAKVGVDLLVSAGPSIVEQLRARGLEVFCDFKLHDIPDQVRSSAREIGRLGARYVTMHTLGGAAMLAEGIAGLAEGSVESGRPPAVALGVTVLTSEPDASAFGARLEVALDAGCGGVVCSAREAAAARAAGAGVIVTPGIRLAGADDDDQARTETPGAAVRAGADVLVLGRAVTGAPDPRRAAAEVVELVRRARRS